MFGKTRDTDNLNEFFGDETTAEHTVELQDLRDRVEQVESQISSQFTSLATYVQIAHEQIELARSEARAATDRSEQRLTSLIERERADRISSSSGPATQGASHDLTARLEALEQSVLRIEKGLAASREQQMALAAAIATTFERLAPARPAESAFDAPPKTGTAFDAPPKVRTGADLPAPTIAEPISSLAFGA